MSSQTGSDVAHCQQWRISVDSSSGVVKRRHRDSCCRNILLVQDFSLWGGRGLDSLLLVIIIYNLNKACAWERNTHTHASVEWNQIYWIHTCNKHKHSISSVLCRRPQTHKVLEHTHKYTIKASDFQTNRTKPKKITCDVLNRHFNMSQTGCLGLTAEFEKV